MKTRATRTLTGLLVPVLLVAIWWGYGSAGEPDSPYFPPLPEILRGFVDTWTWDRIAADLAPSVVSLFVGFTLAVVFGLFGGVALGLSDRLRRDVRPVTEFFRALPVAALVPLALVVIGPGTWMVVVLVAFGAVWPVLIATADGVRSADRVMLDSVRVFGVSRRRRLLRVVIPSALPQIMAGVRIAVAAAVAVMVVANMLGSSSGLGNFVITAQQSFNILETWAGILMIGLVGCLTTALVVAAENVLLRWHRQWRAVDQQEA